MQNISIKALVLLALTWAAFGGDPKFINSKHIPTAEQALKEWTPLPNRNPLPDRPSVSKGDLDYSDLIASFEKHYPGAIYVTLGRDASLAGWILDSFYTQIGQPGRVVYLKGSSGTIKGASHKDLVRMLEGEGIDLDPKKVNSTPPVIFIDSIMRGDSSQVGYLLAAAFEEFEKRGGKRADLAEKMVGYNMDGDGTNEIDGPGFKSTLKGMVADVKNRNRNFPEIISSSVSIPRNSEWHLGFGNITRHQGGKYYGTLNGPSNIATRRQMASDLYEILKVTGSKSYLDSVKKAAKKKGFEFNLKGYVPPPPPKPKTEQELKDELVALAANMVEHKRKKHDENPNADAMLKWIEEETAHQGAKAFLLALPVLQDLKKTQKIGTRDLREILAAGIGELTVDAQLIQDLEPLVEQNSRIEKSLADQGKYFLEQEGPIADNYAKIIRRIGILRPCYQALKKAGALPDGNQ